MRVEMVYRVQKERAVLDAMRAAHPYEEVAFDLLPLANSDMGTGSGLLGVWDVALPEEEFLSKLRSVFGLRSVRHTRLLGKPLQRVALCGGSGAFLLGRAKALGADAFITGDLKYHQYFDADGDLLMADIGHYGSEQFTMHLVQRRLGEVFSTFAVRLTEIVTDPIYHY